MNEDLIEAFLDEITKIAYEQDPRIHLILSLCPELYKDAGLKEKIFGLVGRGVKKPPVRAKITSVMSPKTMKTYSAAGSVKSITPKKMIMAKRPKGPFDTPENLKLWARGG